jgi:hypothetical protein
MHPALHLPHVLDQIAAQFSHRRSVEDDQAFQALALVSHAFSDAALSQVWDQHVALGEDGKPYKVLVNIDVYSRSRHV